MAHLNNMWKKNEAEWAGKVRIFALSCDDQATLAHRHIKQRKWTDVDQFHVGFEHPMVVAFDVEGVPQTVLVDKRGKIVFIDHPNLRKFEDDINMLVSGKKITGPGTVAP